MKKKIFAAVQYLFFLGIGVFLTWWQLGKMTDVESEQFRQSFRNAQYIYVLPVFFIIIASHISRAMRWKILIEPMGYRPRLSNTFYTTMCGYLANTFLPRVGEILRCTLLARHERIPVSKLLGTILLERIFDLFCYGIVIMITILIQLSTVRDFIETTWQKIFEHKNSLSLAITAGIMVLLAVIFFAAIRYVFKKYHAHPVILRIKNVQVNVKEGFSTVRHLKKRKQFVAHTIFIWFAYLMEIYIGFHALKETAHLGITAAFSVLSLATLAMIVSPGGLGAFPIAIQQVLLIYNLDNISFGWLMWGISTLIVIVVGLLCMGLLFLQNKKPLPEGLPVPDEKPA